MRKLRGEDLGKIEDLMIDVECGSVGYAVLSFGGIFGVGSKLFGVPWSALTVNAAEHRVVTKTPRERLEQAPGFDRDAWSDFADDSFRSGIDNCFAAPH